MKDLTDTTKSLIASANAKLAGEQRRAESTAVDQERHRQWQTLMEHQWTNASRPTLKSSIQTFIEALKQAGSDLEVYDAGLFDPRSVRMFLTLPGVESHHPYLEFSRDGESARARTWAYLPGSSGSDRDPDLGTAEVTEEWVIEMCERFFRLALRLPALVAPAPVPKVPDSADELKVFAMRGFLVELGLPQQAWIGTDPDEQQRARFAGHEMVVVPDGVGGFDLQYLGFQTGGFSTMEAAKVAAPAFARRVLAMMAQQVKL